MEGRDGLVTSENKRPFTLVTYALRVLLLVALRDENNLDVLLQALMLEM